MIGTESFDEREIVRSWGRADGRAGGKAGGGRKWTSAEVAEALGTCAGAAKFSGISTTLTPDTLFRPKGDRFARTTSRAARDQGATAAVVRPGRPSRALFYEVVTRWRHGLLAGAAAPDAGRDRSWRSPDRAGDQHKGNDPCGTGVALPHATTANLNPRGVRHLLARPGAPHSLSRQGERARRNRTLRIIRPPSPW